MPVCHYYLASETALNLFFEIRDRFDPGIVMTVRRKGKKMRKAFGNQGKILKFVAFMSMPLALMAHGVQAQSLEEALSAAYKTNPTLAAAQAQLREIDEGVPQAKSGWRPRITAVGSFGAIDSSTTNNKTDVTTEGSSLPMTASLSLSQSLSFSRSSPSANFVCCSKRFAFALSNGSRAVLGAKRVWSPIRRAMVEPFIQKRG